MAVVMLKKCPCGRLCKGTICRTCFEERVVEIERVWPIYEVMLDCEVPEVLANEMMNLLMEKLYLTGSDDRASARPSASPA